MKAVQVRRSLTCGWSCRRPWWYNGICEPYNWAAQLSRVSLGGWHMAESTKGRVRTPFRVLAWILAPILLLSGVWGLGVSIHALITGGLTALRAHSEYTSLGTGGVVFGSLFLRAAITGWDPNVRRDE